MQQKPLIIALYLPQFHPIPENDEWWGKGFTEWTSVGNAKPLFKGHYQPKVPADLGYYDLRLPIVREQQAQMAKDAGIDGFCYWHYWFGNGKQLMADIIDDVLASETPDFPFCLGWANHSWYAKNWNSNDTKGKDRLLIEQTYPGKEDIRMHYNYVRNFFKDPRYIKIDNKPFFMVFNAKDTPAGFIESWNQWAKEDGFDGVYFAGNIPNSSLVKEFVGKGFNAVIIERLKNIVAKRKEKKLSFVWNKIKAHLFAIPDCKYNYNEVIDIIVDPNSDINEHVIPSIIPNFDHSPRSGRYGLILHGSTPELFSKMCTKVFNLIDKKQNKIVLLRSWNEWGEGNYMEPDLRYKNQYLVALKKALEKYGK